MSSGIISRSELCCNHPSPVSVVVCTAVVAGPLTSDVLFVGVSHNLFLCVLPAPSKLWDTTLRLWSAASGEKYRVQSCG